MTTHSASVVIHIDEQLSPNSLHRLEHEFATSRGVKAACVNEKTPHLMVVDYDPQAVTASDLLHHVQFDGFHAELIGGI